ncbi:MAG TPA: YceI family protein [Myxococcota bacterium]|nr:YceI family protein [Myxococcota bacterium]HQK52514.1 YceI family protein [Myxococcota bacterium]
MKHRLIAAVIVAGIGGLSSVARAAESYQVDPVHSQVLFQVNHLGIGQIWGWFQKFEGTIVLDAADAARSSVEFTLVPESVNTRDEKRDQHLRGPDFFNVKQAPKWTFRSRSVREVGNDTFEIEGDLTVRGVTKPLKFKARKLGQGNDPWGNYRIGLSARFTVNRMDFGISYMPEGLGREVEVILDIEAIRQK